MNSELLIEIVTLWRDYTDYVKKGNHEKMKGLEDLKYPPVSLLDPITLTGFLYFLTTKLTATPSKGGVVKQISPKSLQLQNERELSKVKNVSAILAEHKKEHKDDLS